MSDARVLSAQCAERKLTLHGPTTRIWIESEGGQHWLTNNKNRKISLEETQQKPKWPRVT